MAITLQDLRIINVIAREANLSRAASSLGLTQPALSWALKKVEKELDLKLFHRTKKGVLPTRAGLTFLGRTNNIVTSWENLKHNLHQDEMAIRGRFTLGIHGTLAATTMPKFAPTLLKTYPHIEIQPYHDFSRYISQGVIDYRYDYGIVVNPPQHPDLILKQLYQDQVQFFVSDNPSVLQQPNHPDALWICNPDMIQTEQILQKISKRGTWNIRRILYTTDLLVIASMTAAGGGIGLLPATFVKSYPTWELKPLVDTSFREDTICLVWRGEAQKSAASQIVRRIIIESLQREGKPGRIPPS